VEESAVGVNFCHSASVGDGQSRATGIVGSPRDAPGYLPERSPFRWNGARGGRPRSGGPNRRSRFPAWARWREEESLPSGSPKRSRSQSSTPAQWRRAPEWRGPGPSGRSRALRERRPPAQREWRPQERSRPYPAWPASKRGVMGPAWGSPGGPREPWCGAWHACLGAKSPRCRAEPGRRRTSSRAPLESPSASCRSNPCRAGARRRSPPRRRAPRRAGGGRGR
jgi:hypothetical protein